MGRSSGSVVVLCGGFGAARFVSGLRSHPDLTCIVNVGDDHEHLSLLVCPDGDSVLYGLAGQFDEERGWGLVDDTFHCADALARYDDGWFRVGDRDLALCLERTAMLRAGAALSEVTAALTKVWGITARLLPVTDDRLRTLVDTDQGRLTLQEFLVRHRAAPAICGISYHGAEVAVPAPGVAEAIGAASVVVVAPSNPVSSIGPMLAVSGIRHALAAHPAVVAVTPVVRGVPPRARAEASRFHVRERMLESAGSEHRASAIAWRYRDIVDGFVLDERDAGERPAIEAGGVEVLVADTLAPPGRPREALADAVLDFGRALRSRRHREPVVG